MRAKVIRHGDALTKQRTWCSSARRQLGLWLALGLAGSTHAQRASGQYRLELATDRPDAVYRVGQKVGFAVGLWRDGRRVTQGQMTYVLDHDGIPQTSGSLALGEEPMVIHGKRPSPGFLGCRVTYQPQGGQPIWATAAAGIEPSRIAPSLPPPQDFDQFWDQQLGKVAAHPAKADWTPIPSPDKGIECFDIQIPCLGDKPVSGYLARPAHANRGSLPAILYLHGAGVRSADLQSALNGAHMGMLALDINAHGIPNGRPDDDYKALRRGKLKDYPHRGRDSPASCYFLFMYLRVVVALDFLTSQPEWDHRVLVVTGHSQGGAQAIVAAGLDPRVTLVAAGVPALCDHSAAVVGRSASWPGLVPTDTNGKPDPKILQVARYFDTVNFAKRVKAQAVVAVGFVDTACPPSTVYAAYNSLTGPKQILNEPRMGHAVNPRVRSAFTAIIREHIRQSKGPVRRGFPVPWWRP